MQSIQLQIEDNIYETLISRKIDIKEKITQFLSNLTIDKNLKEDPYFYERQKELHQLRDDVKSGKMKMYEGGEFELEMDDFEAEMILKYAH